MSRPLLLSMFALTACFGSLSPDRTPTGVAPPEGGPPPPPVPPPPPPVSIASVKIMSPGSIKVGAQVQVTAIARNAEGQVVTLDGELPTYFSTNPRVASISSGGLLRAVSPGHVQVVLVVREFHERRSITVTN